jgi:hypothetical protein
MGPLSNLLPIGFKSLICPNCKKLQESGRFLSQKRKVVPFDKFGLKCGSFILTTPYTLGFLKY